ncbi:MAG: hypothetical protein ABSC06_34780, partial [Rhodopila sp.]
MTGTLAVSSGSLFIGTPTGSTASIALNAAVGDFKTVSCYTAGVARWLFGSDTTAESGSNAGSNFSIYSFTDAGASNGAVFTINRATGLITLPQGAAITGGSINNATIGASNPSSGAFTTLAAGITTITDLSGGVQSLSIVATGGAGANIKLVGNGSTTPNKYIRAYNGAFEIISSLYTAALLHLTDAGNLTAYGGIDSTAIGATTPSTGAFTTLSASGTVSGTGFSNYLAAPPAIGGTTPGVGSFSALNVITASSSTLLLKNNSNGTDAKLFDSYIDAGNIYFRFVNDAYSAASTWLQATRSGYAISYVYITAPTVQVNGNLNAVNSVSGGAAQISQQNANTAANTQSRMEISTGTANSYAIWAVTENGSGASQALLTCGAGVTQGLQIQSATTAAPITFYQGSSLRLQIDSSGNVDVANALNVGGPLTITDPSTSNTASLTVSATADGNGANILLTGNGATTPAKFLRANSGNFQVINSAYSAVILQLTDAGLLNVNGLNSTPVGAGGASTGAFTTLSASGVTVAGAVNATAGNVFADYGRNLLLNGRFNIQQRGAGAWTASGNYSADRWQLSFIGDTDSVTVVTLADTDRTAIGDESAEYGLQLVVTGVNAAGDYSQIYQ